MKAIAGKAYGHIPHLPNSRLGPGDHRVHEGSARILTERARDGHDRIIVTQKLDGANVAVQRLDGRLVPLSRKGHAAWSSPYEQHRLFAEWVARQESRFHFLAEGERLCGEWLAQAHGTRYALPHEPWVVFDLIGADNLRAPFDVLRDRASGFVLPQLISDGPPLSAEKALLRADPAFHGAVDAVEGAVWRCERRGAFEFMAKYVRPDKADGCYLPSQSGRPEVWNWHPRLAAAV